MLDNDSDETGYTPEKPISCTLFTVPGDKTGIVLLIAGYQEDKDTYSPLRGWYNPELEKKHTGRDMYTCWYATIEEVDRLFDDLVKQGVVLKPM